MIKRLLIIGLCSLLALEALLPNVDLADLSYLPELLSHYQRHKSQSPDITFSEFLSLHYDDPAHLATSPTDHQHLPFSKRQHHRGSFQIAQEPFAIHTQITYFVLTESKGVFDMIIPTSKVASPIWQPPRA
jgi:hypothetical protein